LGGLVVKGPKIKDERIITEIQKFSTHGLLIVLVGFMISLLVKVFILEWDIKYWVDTFGIMLLGCLYVTVRCVKDGIYLLPSKEGELKRFKKIHLISGVISTIIWATLTFLLDFREADIRKNISSTLVGSVVFFIGVTWAMWYIINKSNKNADKNIKN
jgi:protein-S-isoprenylcysteine O-methyltransferase Ste14